MPRSNRMFGRNLQALFLCACVSACRPSDSGVAENRHQANAILEELNSINPEWVDELECPERHNVRGSGELRWQIDRHKDKLKIRGYLAVWDKERRTYRLEPDPSAPQAMEILQRLNDLAKDSVDVFECPERHAHDVVDAEIAALTDKFKADLKALEYFVDWDQVQQRYEFQEPINRYGMFPDEIRQKLNELEKDAVDIVECSELHAGEKTNGAFSALIAKYKEELKAIDWHATWKHKDRKYWFYDPRTRVSYSIP